MMINTMNGKRTLAGIAGLGLLVGCLNTTGSDSDASAALRAGAAAKDSADKAHKVYVCHIPPGNPANAHTIHVGSPALEAHLAHGDSLGVCGSTTGGGTDSTGTGEGSGTGTGTGSETGSGSGSGTGSEDPVGTGT